MVRLATLGIDGVGDLVDVRGDAELAFEAGATLMLSTGVDLADPFAPQPFIDDSTGVQFFTKALGNDNNFDASLGPLGLFIRSGQAGINDTGAGSNNPATLTFTLADDDDGGGDGRHYFEEDLIGDLTSAVVLTTPRPMSTSGNSPAPPDSTPFRGRAPICRSIGSSARPTLRSVRARW